VITLVIVVIAAMGMGDDRGDDELEEER